MQIVHESTKNLLDLKRLGMSVAYWLYMENMVGDVIMYILTII